MKSLIFALLPLFILLLVLEVGARLVFYQIHGRYPVAFWYGVEKIQNTLAPIKAKIKAKKTFEDTGIHVRSGSNDEILKKQNAILQSLYSEKGKPLLDMFQQEYSQYFQQLIQEAHAVRTHLAVLYIPFGDYDQQVQQREVCRNFYRELTENFGIDFIDMTAVFLEFPSHWTTLLPENGHLSRFGNQLIVEELTRYIARYGTYRSDVTFQQRPALLGDIQPNVNTIWTTLPDMPYQVITNSQGLRMEYDLVFPKTEQRILVLGDSVTFGAYLHNHQAYPNLLDRAFPDKEVINAGQVGYTITDEVSFFQERGKYVEPDITILQVLDNDLFGLFAFKKNQFDRKGRTFAPSELEKEFLKTIVQDGF